jgi:chromate reductase, NAD(P)H dehydrogenase (quinone)
MMVPILHHGAAMPATRLLVISGSQRQGSYNRSLAAYAAAHARSVGAEAVEFDLRALALPLYDGDLEAQSGVPAAATTLLQAIHHCDAVLVVTPEYNGFPTPLLINAFDWLSRIKAAPPLPAGLAATAGKPAGLLAASPGPLGGLRSMNYVRQYLQMAFAMLVAPQQYALGRAGEAFDETGALRDPKAAAAATGVVDALLNLAGTLARGRAAKD